MWVHIHMCMCAPLYGSSDVGSGLDTEIRCFFPAINGVLSIWSVGVELVALLEPYSAVQFGLTCRQVSYLADDDLDFYDGWMR